MRTVLMPRCETIGAPVARLETSTNAGFGIPVAGSPGSQSADDVLGAGRSHRAAAARIAARIVQHRGAGIDRLSAVGGGSRSDRARRDRPRRQSRQRRRRPESDRDDQRLRRAGAVPHRRGCRQWAGAASRAAADDEFRSRATSPSQAFRLVGGYDDPAADVRFVLTPSDTRDKVARAELVAAAGLTAAVVLAACDATEAEARSWRK